MRTPFSERFAKGLFGALGPVEKAGTSEGAKRGWETRRGRAPVEETPGEERRPKAEDEAEARRRFRAAETAAPPRPAAPAEQPSRRRRKVDEPTGTHPITRSVLDNADTVRAADADNGQIANMSMMGGEDNAGNVYLVEFRDGTKAVYKPTYETVLAAGTMLGPVRESLDDAIPESAREAAAFHLSEAMGMGVVPHVERVNFARAPETRGFRRRELETMIETKLELLAMEEHKGNRGDEFYMDTLRFEIEEATELAEKAADEEELGAGHTMAYVTGEDGDFIDTEDFKRDVAEQHPDLHRITALDIIAGNTDRHMANFRRGDDGRYYAIDNGLSFPTDSNHDDIRVDILDNYLHGSEIPPEVRREIASLDESHLARVMFKAGFDDEDIHGAQSRLAALKGLDRWPRTEIEGAVRNRSSRSVMAIAETEHAMRMVEEF